MQRPLLKHLVVLILAALTSLSIGPLRAQQPLSDKAQSVTIADVQGAYFSADNTDPGTPPSPDSSASATSSSTDQSQTVPPAPQPQSSTDAGKQSKRILGILPNFRAVDADVQLPPESPKDKFISASEDSFDYSSLFIPVALAGYSLGINADPEFGHGGLAYGRYLWHAVVDQTVENYMVEFVVPVATHEDNRYYTLGHGGFLKRTTYALGRAVITRSDSGKEVFNISEIVGAGASAGISTLYYPSAERSLGNTATSWGLDIGIDAASFVLKEFWPDINHSLFHGDAPSRIIPSPQP